MKTLRFYLIIAVTLFAALCPGCKQLARFEKSPYPNAQKQPVADIYHRVKVPDPYRWLEDPDSKQTRRWVRQQNRLTHRFLSKGTPKEDIKARLTELWDYPRYSAPRRHADRYFFWKNDGLQNQSVLYVQQTLDQDPKVVINPNLLSPDGTVAVTSTAVSEDAALLAYALSKSGSDEQQVKIRNIDSAADYDETIDYCKFTSIAWKHDNSGFFYDRFPEPNSVLPEDRNNY
ncbi:MAG: hypothetical protein JSW23_00485, partial [Planctomycetota bacterium]